MSRPFPLCVAVILLFALGVIAANTRIAQGIIPVTAYEADVNKDARVNSGDLGLVASKFGQPVPTASPTVVPTPPVDVVGDRVFVYSNASHHLELLNTTTGQLVASFGDNLGTAGVIDISCHKKYALIQEPLGGTTYLKIVDTRTGNVLVSENHSGGPGEVRVLFPCPLKGAGGAFNTGVPSDNRVVIRVTKSSTEDTFRIYQLQPAVELLSQVESDYHGIFRLSCGQRELVVQFGGQVKIHSLQDGALVLNMPVGSVAPGDC
jgi:hypothetical protein